MTGLGGGENGHDDEDSDADLVANYANRMKDVSLNQDDGPKTEHPLEEVVVEELGRDEDGARRYQ